MKHLKKIASLLLAVVMVLSMSVATFADVDLTKHIFNAYQIFTGTLSADNVLTNINWGTGVKSDELLNAVKDMKVKANEDDTTPFANCATASDVAEVLATFKFDSKEARDFAKIVAEHLSNNVAASGEGSVNLPSAGYYLIKDITNVSNKDDAKNLSLLKVNSAGNVTPRTKIDKPTLVKKVKDINDTDGTTTDWQDSADYDIGDTILYQLTATMGDISDYDKYYVKFWDTMTHLTYTGITSVKVGDTTLDSSDYTVEWNENIKQLTVAIDDVKKYNATKGTKVVVEYTATLDADANIGSAGNPNEAHLEYSNNPNNAGSGEKGNTPNDVNIVFTYKTVINKVDKDGKPLKGAKFALYKLTKGGDNVAYTDKNGTEIKGTWGEPLEYVEKNDDTTIFTFKGLDDGIYKLSEIQTPEGFNSIDDIVFEITASHDETAETPTLTDLNGNKLSGEISFTRDTSIDDALTTSVVNNKGSQLPETGGIGTTIFYVVGVVLMLGAGVLLITKRRMNAKH